MSRSKIFCNFFYKNNHNIKTSTQQLYSIYLCFLKYNNKITFDQFYTYITLSGFYSNKVNQNNTYIFLGYFFFLKTKKTKYVAHVNNLANVVSFKNTVQGFNIDNNMFDF